MNHTITEQNRAALEQLRAFGRHFEYDVTYLEELATDSPLAFQAFTAATNMGRVQSAAPVELLFLVKLAAVRAEDCGPCTALGVKMAREAGVPETVIRGALGDGSGLDPDQQDVLAWARAVAAGEGLDPALRLKLEQRWGREILAELAVNLIATRLYPTLRRALGHQQSCALFPALAA